MLLLTTEEEVTKECEKLCGRLNVIQAMIGAVNLGVQDAYRAKKKRCQETNQSTKNQKIINK